MVEKAVTFDVAAFHAAYKAELPVNVDRVNAAMVAAHAKMGAQPLAAFSIGDAQSTVCTAWPMIRRLVNTVLKFSWVLQFLGKDIQELLKHIPEVKAFLAALEKTFIPVVCGKGETDV